MATIIDDQSLTVSVTSDAVTVTEGDGATFTVAVTGDMSTAHVQVALHGAPDGDIRHGLHGAVGDAGRWVTNVGGDEHDDVGRGLSHSRGNGACAGQRPCPKYKPFSNASPRSDHAGSRPFDATNRNYIAGRANSDQLRKCLNEQVDLVSTTSLLVGDATLSANLAATCAPRIRSAVRAGNHPDPVARRPRPGYARAWCASDERSTSSPVADVRVLGPVTHGKYLCNLGHEAISAVPIELLVVLD